MTLQQERLVAPVRAPWPRDAAIVTAAGAAALAGGIHLAVVPEHLAESWPAGAFFLGLGLAQLALAVAVRRPLPVAVLLAAIGGHLAVLLLYVASRTVDLPFVPPHDVGHDTEHLPVAGGVGNGIPVYPGSRVEPVGLLDVVCLVAELVLVAVLTGMLPRARREVVTTAMVGVAVAALALRLLASPG